MRIGIAAAVLVVPLAMVAVVIGGLRCAHAVDRTERRAGELSLPDPYLDPAWPDEASEGLDGRYEPGASDSVEGPPLDEDPEPQEAAQPELQPPNGQAPPVTTGDAPAAPEPYVPQVDDESPGIEDRDPVEW